MFAFHHVNQLIQSKSELRGKCTFNLFYIKPQSMSAINLRGVVAFRRRIESIRARCTVDNRIQRLGNEWEIRVSRMNEKLVLTERSHFLKHWICSVTHNSFTSSWISSPFVITFNSIFTKNTRTHPVFHHNSYLFISFGWTRDKRTQKKSSCIIQGRIRDSTEGRQIEVWTGEVFRNIRTRGFLSNLNLLSHKAREKKKSFVD